MSFINNNNNNNNNDVPITEDAPQMRSVAMHSSAPPMPLARSFTPSAKPFSTSSVHQRASEPLVSSTKPAWRVSSLSPVPTFYFLERTHVIVSDATPQQIATRTADCMERESVAAVYHDRENFATGETLENVEFTVRLWDQDDKVIVEVQRAAGDSFLFHQIAKAVLRAAKGLKTPSTPKARKVFTIPKGVPQSSADEKKESWEEGLQLACTLLKSDRIDSQCMAVESLLHLTNVCKCPDFTANSILCDEVVGALLSLVECSRLSVNQRDEPVGDLEQQNLCIMHRNAIAVLTNCVCALKDADDLGKVLNDANGLLSEAFLAALVEDVYCAEQKPHDACQAVRCLHGLMDASREVQDKVQQLRVSQALATANRCRHAQLHEASQKLRLCIGEL